MRLDAKRYACGFECSASVCGSSVHPAVVYNFFFFFFLLLLQLKCHLDNQTRMQTHHFMQICFKGPSCCCCSDLVGLISLAGYFQPLGFVLDWVMCNFNVWSGVHFCGCVLLYVCASVCLHLLWSGSSMLLGRRSLMNDCIFHVASGSDILEPAD